MKTTTKNEAEAIKWLENEYPRGVDLVYVDYRDYFEDETQLQQVIKDGYPEDEDWVFESEIYSINEIIDNYMREEDITDITDNVRRTMQDWLLEHNTSDILKQLLKHTGKRLFYIETEDYSEEDRSNKKQLMKKYAKTDEQKKEVDYVINEQFYGAPVSFYFYADVEDVFDAIHKSESKYIKISGAFFTTIDRVQGSNWMGDNAVFTLTIPREDFIKNVYLDGARGNGYGWGEIAGQTSYDEAMVVATNAKKRGTIYLGTAQTSEAQKREKQLQENWDKTHKCIFGDMNWNRHTGERAYINNFPCGNKCEDCGTFWID